MRILYFCLKKEVWWITCGDLVEAAWWGNPFLQGVHIFWWVDRQSWGKYEVRSRVQEVWSGSGGEDGSGWRWRSFP